MPEMQIALIESSDISDQRWQLWENMCRSAGYSVPRYATRAVNGDFADFVGGATGLLLTNDTLLHNDNVLAHLNDAIRNGKRMAVFADAIAPASINGFLDPFGMELTNLKVAHVAGAAPDPGADSMRILRKDYPGAFRDAMLLDGVDSVEVSSPTLIRYGGDASAVLTIPIESRKFGVVDSAAGFPEHWTSPAATCIAHGQRDTDRGSVLVISGAVLRDPCTDGTGAPFAGIHANGQLAQNVLSWLTRSRASANDNPVTAFILIDRIERRLVQYVERKLHGAFTRWWEDGIPEPVRIKCATRCETQCNCLPKEAYLDLIDMRSVLDHNWSLFDPDLRSVGWVGGRRKALHWLVTLGKLRNVVMHPVRRMHDDDDLDDSALAFLRETDSRVFQLSRIPARVQAGGSL